jgi:hypothetical protein
MEAWSARRRQMGQSVSYRNGMGSTIIQRMGDGTRHSQRSEQMATVDIVCLARAADSTEAAFGSRRWRTKEVFAA